MWGVGESATPNARDEQSQGRTARDENVGVVVMTTQEGRGAPGNLGGDLSLAQLLEVAALAEASNLSPLSVSDHTAATRGADSGHGGGAARRSLARGGRHAGGARKGGDGGGSHLECAEGQGTRVRVPN